MAENGGFHSISPSRHGGVVLRHDRSLRGGITPILNPGEAACKLRIRVITLPRPTPPHGHNRAVYSIVSSGVGEYPRTTFGGNKSTAPAAFKSFRLSLSCLNTGLETRIELNLQM